MNQTDVLICGRKKEGHSCESPSFPGLYRFSVTEGDMDSLGFVGPDPDADEGAGHRGDEQGQEHKGCSDLLHGDLLAFSLEYTHYSTTGEKEKSWKSGKKGVAIRMERCYTLTRSFENTPVGAFSDEGPPVPIPNTEVKLISAENTWGAAPWEDRATPTSSEPAHSGWFFFYHLLLIFPFTAAPFLGVWLFCESGDGVSSHL